MQKTMEKLGKNGNFTENSNDGKRKESDSEQEEAFDSESVLHNFRSPRQTETLMIENIT
jgi:hypothetical protein